VNELERALVADSYAAAPDHILEGLRDEVVDRGVEGAPHTIYEELWHVVFGSKSLWIGLTVWKRLTRSGLPMDSRRRRIERGRAGINSAGVFWMEAGRRQALRTTRRGLGR
jgi:hypothetical protein